MARSFDSFGDSEARVEHGWRGCEMRMMSAPIRAWRSHCRGASCVVASPTAKGPVSRRRPSPGTDSTAARSHTVCGAERASSTATPDCADASTWRDASYAYHRTPRRRNARPAARALRYHRRAPAGARSRSRHADARIAACGRRCTNDCSPHASNARRACDRLDDAALARASECPTNGATRSARSRRSSAHARHGHRRRKASTVTRSGRSAAAPKAVWPTQPTHSGHLRPRRRRDHRALRRPSRHTRARPWPERRRDRRAGPLVATARAAVSCHARDGARDGGGGARSPLDLQGPGRRAGRLHRRLEGQPRDQLAALPRLSGAGARRAVHLRGGRLPALVRRAARRRAARRVRGARAVAPRHSTTRSSASSTSCRSTAHPMDVVRTAVSVIGASDPRRARRHARGEPRQGDARCSRSCPSIVAYDQRRRRGLELVEPRDDLGYSRELPAA